MTVSSPSFHLSGKFALSNLTKSEMHWTFLIFGFLVFKQIHANDQAGKSHPGSDLAQIVDDTFLDQLNQAPKSLQTDLERKWDQLYTSFLHQSNDIIHQVSLSIIPKSQSPILQNDHTQRIASEAVSNTVDYVTGNFSKFFHMVFDRQSSKLSKRDTHNHDLVPLDDLIAQQWQSDLDSLLEREKGAYDALISFIKSRDPEYAAAIVHSDRALARLSAVFETEKIVSMAHDLSQAGYRKMIMFQSFMAKSKEYFNAAMDFLKSQEFVERHSQEVMDAARERAINILSMDFPSHEKYLEAK